VSFYWTTIFVSKTTEQNLTELESVVHIDSYWWSLVWILSVTTYCRESCSICACIVSQTERRL